MIEIIPSEIVLSYAGFLVADGKISFVGAVIAGTIGGTLAQIFFILAWILWWTSSCREIREIFTY